MSGAIEIQRSVEIRCNDATWRPPIIKIEGVECIRLATNDQSLVRLVASISDIKLPSQIQIRKDKLKLNLTGVSGFCNLRKMRNDAQASELVSDAPRQALFAAPDGSAMTSAKKHKRTHEQLSDLRSNSELFDVPVGDGVHVCLQRPILNKDVIVAKLDDDNVRNTLRIITGEGFDMDDVFAGTRSYRQFPGAWKFGKYVYAKSEGSLQRRKNLEASDEEDSSDHAVGSAQDDDDSSSGDNTPLSELPDVQS